VHRRLPSPPPSRDWADEFAFARDAELHGSDLWHGSGDFAFVIPGVRRALYDDALDVLVEAQPLVVIRGVGREKLYLTPPSVALRDREHR
jgi:hypothetical protein